MFGCVVSTRLDSDGYGRNGRRLAHLVVFEAEHGAITPGMFVDHLCRNRACKAVHHLELVTKSENEKRKQFKYRVKRKTCAKGHDLQLHRVITPEGGIVCRACNLEAREQLSNGL
jgi:hypothetical protein